MAELWRKQRKEIVQREGEECQYCGSEDELEVHHIRPRREFSQESKSNHRANLVTLCTDCHRRLEPHSPERQRTVLAKYGVEGDIRGIEFRSDKEYLSGDAPAQPLNPMLNTNE